MADESTNAIATTMCSFVKCQKRPHYHTGTSNGCHRRQITNISSSTICFWRPCAARHNATE